MSFGGFYFCCSKLVDYFFRLVSLLWHVISPFFVQLYSVILTLQLDQFLGGRSFYYCYLSFTWHFNDWPQFSLCDISFRHRITYLFDFLYDFWGESFNRVIKWFTRTREIPNFLAKSASDFAWPSLIMLAYSFAKYVGLRYFLWGFWASMFVLADTFSFHHILNEHPNGYCIDEKQRENTWVLLTILLRANMKKVMCALE